MYNTPSEVNRIQSKHAIKLKILDRKLRERYVVPLYIVLKYYTYFQEGYLLYFFIQTIHT